MMDKVASKQVAKPSTRCPYCHAECEAEGARSCEQCLAPHHAECWTAAGGCAACRFSAAPARIDAPAALPAGAPLRPPLTRDLARETLVRAGWSLAEVDAVFGAPARAEVDLTLRTPVQGGGRLQVLLRGFLAQVSLGAGGLAAVALASAASRGVHSDAFEVGLGAAIVSLLALVLVFALRRR